ncbi:DUF1707 SHOCT-like domain-containing protein [Nocardioides dongxiaopingii]|uniref:DUF1707 SHOCT-like domain-containing protein n=1 Tax=Nocardioides dongxiaopingii TaxID=2576036 RepID=UPI001BAFEABB|nr:DUF1707 domain-containing protein [Nocardioides dongxiaopingii]
MVDLWSSFPLDPREKAHAGLRASDEDRELIRAELSSAFGAGKLDADELEERLDAVGSARTLGDLPPIVSDLVPLKPPPARPTKSLVGIPHDELQRRAVAEWQDRRRNAVSAFVGSAVICWAIWLAIYLGTDGGAFPWPLIVNAVTLLNLVRTSTSREVMVRDELARLEKKQARQQRWPKGLA